MKTFSSYLKHVGVFLCSALLLFACSKKNDGPETVKSQLVLTVSTTEIDEGDEVDFIVTAGGEAVNADIYIDGTKINDTKHTFAKTGLYQVTAKKEGYTDSQVEKIKVYQVDVYVAGGESLGGYLIPKYWKNGRPIELPSTNKIAVAGSIFVSEGTVYVAGTEFNDDGSGQTLKYWKDGVPTILTTHGLGDIEIDIVSLFVSEGDVYVSAADLEDNIAVAKYWKNGAPTALTDGTKDAYSSSIFVSGKDVYVAGVENTEGGRVAKYWKNGIPLELTDETNVPVVLSIYVSKEDVYVAAMVDGEPNTVNAMVKYWKNGEATDLTDGSQQASALSIAVDGEDVYIAGFEASSAKYWKNGKAVSLTDGSEFGMASSIVIDKGNVYVVGREGDSALYWKNGQAVNLTTEGSQLSVANSIFVARSLGKK